MYIHYKLQQTTPVNGHTHTHTHRRRTHHKHNIMQRKKKIRCSLACSARQALCCCSELALRDSSRSLSIMKHWLCSPLSAPSSSCCLATAPDSSVHTHTHSHALSHTQVNFSEPISFMQRMTEELIYSRLLDVAATCDHSIDELPMLQPLLVRCTHIIYLPCHFGYGGVTRTYLSYFISLSNLFPFVTGCC